MNTKTGGTSKFGLRRKVCRIQRIAALASLMFSALCLAQTNSSTVSAQTDKKMAAILADWENLTSIFDDIDIYAGQIRELVEIGKPAVPMLTAALDGTSRDTQMRLLAFTLRAIGDARAVPALIRTIPRTLLPPGSDCGMSVKDPDLLKFMQAHDLDETSEEKRFSRRDFGMGRPVREVAIALRKITGTNQNETEIFMTFLDGGEQQRAVQKQRFHEVASRWADWWKTNCHRLVDDPAFADVRLPPPPKAPPLNRFLTGATIKTSEGMDGMIAGPIEEKGRQCCVSLSLNRAFDLPPDLKQTHGDAVSPETISAWAAHANVDLVATRYREPNSGKSYYCLRGLGLQAWEIPNKHWNNINDELQRDALPGLDAPAGDLLMHYDATQARYLPEKKATFLFITRDGWQGILRVTAQVTRLWTAADMGLPLMRSADTGSEQTSEAGPCLGVKFDYKFFYTETDALHTEARAREEARSARNQNRQHKKMASLLEKYPHLTGNVYLPDGAPAANAALLLGVKNEAAILGNRKFEFADQSTIVHTKTDGAFVLPQVPDARSLYVAHEQGFLELNLDEAKSPLPIHLLPWGRIEGILTLEGKPAPNQKVALLNAFTYYGVNHLSLSPGSFTTESDSHGRFTFDAVPPGEIQVCRLLHNTYYEGQHVQVTAGKTTVFRHGFNGRLLKGRLVASDSSTNITWNGGMGFRFATKSTPPSPPAGENPQTWMQKFYQSPEGKALQRTNYNFGVDLEASGQFQVHDVPPGTYQFSGDVRDGPANNLFAGGKTLGHLNETVIVPELQPGKSDETLDLGNIVVQMVLNLKTGDAAPDFEIKTIDGAPLHLADFRGKYVLIDFWATWCGPCRGETPELKAVYDSYGKNPKFAMIGLSLDKEAKAPKDYTTKEGMPWLQGFLGDWSEAKLPTKYGVEGIPAIFLLDPDGKIFATGLRGRDIKAVVASALRGP